jgi:hypothetical protein
MPDGALFSHEEENHVAYRKIDGVEIIKLNEISQIHKDKYCLFSLICGI